MRTNEERIKAMHMRAAELEREKQRKRIQIIRVVSVAACFALTIGLAVFMSGLSAGSIEGADPDALRASIFSGSKILSYIVMGIIAFALGVFVTVFCFSIKVGRASNNEEPGR
ncbi:MAG: DUF4179 domain-containing protein [Firmicutes bacterium]|nr:DUF4179 domain-containing protein [Bacillota bacterium]